MLIADHVRLFTLEGKQILAELSTHLWTVLTAWRSCGIPQVLLTYILKSALFLFLICSGWLRMPGGVLRGFQLNRERMVGQIEARGISDNRVLSAMRRIPRHLFVDEALQAQAYGDHPVPIGFGQTLSQPYIVALMSSLLIVRPQMRILEIGAGSGYQAAVLAAMGAEVFTVERIRQLYLTARKRLLEMKLFNIRVKLDDGTLGWAEEGPFDRIIVTAGGPEVPEPLLTQLTDPGIMLIPVGQTKREQRLLRIFKKEGRIHREDQGSVAFVDLVGSHGW